MSDKSAKIGADHFERPELWGPGGSTATPSQRERAREVLDALPAGTRTVLDVGCGDGTITNRLAERFEVTGVDPSETALQHVKARSLVASADELPFPDRSFDAVVATEVLEHLDEPTFRAAVAEIARVARETIVITVPNRELLRQSEVRCPRCGTRFNPWRHQRSFSPRSFPGLFPEFELELTRETGPPKMRVTRLEAWLRSSLARRRPLWFPALCPECGLEGTEPRARERSPLHFLARWRVGRTLDHFAWRARRRLRPRPRPTFLLGRFRREV